MKYRRSLAVVLVGATLALGALLPIARAEDATPPPAPQKCATLTFPHPLAGAVVTASGFTSKKQAQQWLENTDQRLAELLASNLFAGLSCEGCKNNLPGCFPYIHMVGQTYPPPTITPNGDGTFTVTFTLTGGFASFGCWSCPE